MYKLIAFVSLAAASATAFASIGGPNPVPAPGILPLLGIGAAVMIARHFKK
jgi:hypothetical protein